MEYGSVEYAENWLQGWLERAVRSDEAPVHAPHVATVLTALRELQEEIQAYQDGYQQGYSHGLLSAQKVVDRQVTAITDLRNQLHAAEKALLKGYTWNQYQFSRREQS